MAGFGETAFAAADESHQLRRPSAADLSCTFGNGSGR